MGMRTPREARVGVLGPILCAVSMLSLSRAPRARLELPGDRGMCESFSTKTVHPALLCLAQLGWSELRLRPVQRGVGHAIDRDPASADALSRR
jgi:hypothetical protein